MKKALFGLIIALSATGVLAQEDHTSGYWYVTTEPYHYATPILSIGINTDENAYANGKLTLLSIDGDIWDRHDWENHVFDNPSSLTVTLNKEYPSDNMVATMSLSAVSIGNPSFLYGMFQRTKLPRDPNASSIDCFTNGDCIFGQQNVYLRRAPNRRVNEEELTINTQSQSFIELEEIRFTPTGIEVLLFFNTGTEDYGGTLHPPGRPNTFYLRDNFGNRYDLLSQQGWPGPDEGGFGSYTIPGNLEDEEKVHVLLFFEPTANYENINRLDLVEGTCTGGCWNFYGVRLND